MARMTQNTIPPETVTNPDDALFTNPRFIVYLLKQIDAKMDEQKVDSATYQKSMEARFEEINRTLDKIPGKYVTKEELNKEAQTIRKERKDIIDTVSARLASHDTIITRIAWTIVLTVLGALLMLVVKGAQLPGL